MDITKAIQTLKEQLGDYTERERYFNTMKLKAMGAIEVLEQLERDDKKEDKK
tara:strand:- start:239 stop:394 length:156 start_codon:yes stop_codon:yes gene_type:complete